MPTALFRPADPWRTREQRQQNVVDDAGEHVVGLHLLQEFGVAFAVALDAFLIRFALVPALVYILGDRNWALPTWLGWLPRMNLEATETPGTGTVQTWHQVQR